MAFDTRLLSGLAVFAAVVETGGFSRAGQRLGLTQSGVSRAIHRLEERLGVRLLERTSKIMRLTEAGQVFHREVRPLLVRLEEAADEAVEGNATVRGRLRVNVDPTFARLILAPRVGEFFHHYPDLELDLVVRDGLGDLLGDGFDAAIRFGDAPPSTLIARVLRRVRVLTCATPAYLAKHGTPRHPRDLGKGHECLMFRDPATGNPFPWEFHRGKRVLTVPVSGRFLVNDALTHLNACLAGCGVAQIFEWGATECLASGQLVNLFPGWSDELFPLYVYYPSRQFVPTKLRVFIDFVVGIGEP